MKELGFPIEYDKSRKTYFYQKDGKLVNNLFQMEIDKDEMKRTKGGIDILMLNGYLLTPSRCSVS